MLLPCLPPYLLPYLFTLMSQNHTMGFFFIESSQMLQFTQVSCSASTVASHRSEVAGCGSSASKDSRLHHSVVLEAQGHELRFLTFPSQSILDLLALDGIVGCSRIP